jgi:hypothetical protein
VVSAWAVIRRDARVVCLWLLTRTRDGIET